MNKLKDESQCQRVEVTIRDQNPQVRHKTLFRAESECWIHQAQGQRPQLGNFPDVSLRSKEKSAPAEHISVDNPHECQTEPEGEKQQQVAFNYSSHFRRYIGI